VLRCIAVERGIHVVLFTLAAVIIFIFTRHEEALRTDFQRIAADLQGGGVRPGHGLIADINRYVEEPIEMDPDVGELQFSGLVYESQVKTFLQDLEIIFPVKVSRTAQNHILIQARDAVGPKKLDGSP